MAYPSVTYSFTNGTTADATQVNQNFTDIINGLSDGTKDLSVKNIGASGKITVTETTDSTSGSTGSINTLGGLGVTKAIYCGSSITCVTSAISPLYTATAALEVRSVTTLTLNAGTTLAINVANATTPVSAATCAATGAWSFFPNTNANLSMSLTPASTAASYARSIGWGIGGYDASLPTAGTISAGEKLVLYRNGSSIETKIGVGDTSTVAGTYLAVGGSGSTGNGIAFAIYSAAATTTYTSIMSATYAGAFTWGPSSGSNLTHVVQSGASTYLNIKAGGVGVSVINADGGSKVLYIQVNGTNVSSVGETGSWGFPLVYNITVGATNRDLYIDNTGIIGYVSSSIRYKENIREMVSVLANINKFRPCIFDYKDASKGVNKVGVIAEDFQDWLPNIVSYAENGEVETIQHSALAVVALKGVQELAAENDLLKARIAALEAA